MERRANFRSPLLGLERARGGYPSARFRTRMGGPALGMAVVVFLLVDLFLVYRLTRDDDVVPSARLPVGSLDEPVAGPLDTLDGRDGTEVGAPMLSAEELAGMGGAKPATSGKQVKESGPGSDTGSTNAVSGSSTSTTSDSGGSTSTTSDSGGSGSGSSDSGSSDSGGSGSDGSGSDGSGSGEGGPGGGGSGGSGGGGGSGDGGGSGGGDGSGGGGGGA